MSLAILWTAKSSNRKTGPIPVTTTSAETCPSSCPFSQGRGCYAENDRLGLIWRALTTAGPNASWQSGVATLKSIDWRGLCARVKGLPEGQLWRHNQAGDLPHRRGRILKGRLMALVRANKGKRGWTYSHHDMRNSWNRALIRWANRNGFAVNLSGNSMPHADKLAKLKIAPVVTVLPSDTSVKTLVTPEGRVVRVCPATYADKVSCKTCKWCAMIEREFIVGFPAHGARKGAIDARSI